MKSWAELGPAASRQSGLGLLLPRRSQMCIRDGWTCPAQHAPHPCLPTLLQLLGGACSQAIATPSKNNLLQKPGREVVTEA